MNSESMRSRQDKEKVTKTRSILKSRHPHLPVILAGGIVPENAANAAAVVRPSALDVASGAELSPGIKDFRKVTALLAAIRVNGG